MSLKKKLEKELEKISEDICVDNTNYDATYYIYVWENKNKSNGFTFWYNRNFSFKKNIMALKLYCRKYFIL